MENNNFNISDDIWKWEYNWWLVSNNLIKRSLAVVWHYTLWSLIIFLPIFLIIIIISILWFSTYYY